MIFETIAFFILGVIFGSFTNVLIARVETMESLLGRSRCRTCNHELTFIDLIPIISYISTNGHCRYCGAKYYISYPIVEFAMGVLFALYIALGVEAHYVLAFLPFLLAIIVVDIKYKEIPDLFSLPLIFLTFITVLIDFSFGLLIAGPLFTLPFLLIWGLSKGRAMGSGDVLLALHIGWLVGLGGIVSTFLFIFWFGTIVIGLLWFIKKIAVFSKSLKKVKLNLKTEIPFAPFMIITALIHIYFNLNDLLYYIFL